MRSTAKIFYRSIRRLSFDKLMRLAGLVLRHPLFTILATFATFRTYTTAEKYFPDTSSTNGIGNAFRHALWTSVVMMYCCKISSPQKALAFCKKFTDMHEELFPNLPLETKMDLHNNQVGMDLFMEMLPGIHRQFFEINFFIGNLFEKTKTAKLLTSVEEDHGNELVYLEE